MVAPATQENVNKRNAILSAFENMTEGEEMTYEKLSQITGHSVTTNDSQFAWARRHAPNKRVVVTHVRGTDRFKRLTKEEIAMDTSRARRIRKQAKSGFAEATVAMQSNDKNISNVASAKAMRYSLIQDAAPVSNRKLINDKI